MQIRRPDDCHVHLREGDILKQVLPFTERFGRGVIMPNLKQPLTKSESVISYYHTIKNLCESNFEPKMTIWFDENTEIKDLEELKTKDFFAGCKWYPSNVSVNSDLDKFSKQLKYLEDKNIPLLIHPEDMLDKNLLSRESSFIKNIALPLAECYPKLRIVLEHITTTEAYLAVMWRKNLWATITPHHLFLELNDLFCGNLLQTHNYCLPIPKFNSRCLLTAATSGSNKFFAGTDSAPHTIVNKQKHGVPGCFTAPRAIEHYATAFDSVHALNKLEDFISSFGAEFYGWGFNKETITLEECDVNPDPLVYLYFGVFKIPNLKWKVKNEISKCA